MDPVNQGNNSSEHTVTVQDQLPTPIIDTKPIQSTESAGKGNEASCEATGVSDLKSTTNGVSLNSNLESKEGQDSSLLPSLHEQVTSLPSTRDSSMENVVGTISTESSAAAPTSPNVATEVVAGARAEDPQKDENDRMDISEKHEMRHDGPVKTESDLAQEQSSVAEADASPFVMREFDTLASAEAAIQLPALTNEEEEEEPIKVEKFDSVRRGPGRSSTSRSTSKRGRSSAASVLTSRDDDDTEMSEGASQQRLPPKKRARVTESARSSISGLPASELSLDDLPVGWTSPLLYFATMTKKQTWKQWKALPERRVCNGAIWLSPTCTGTPGLSDHVDGPTAILRDLLAVLQNPADPIKLHENNYTSLARANVRSSVPASKITNEFAVTRVIKALTEKEYLQRLPLDLICSLLVQQLRHMMNKCKRFPSHLFASELHLFQCAPTVAFHLQANEIPFSLASLLGAFGDSATRTTIEALREEYRKNIGTRSLGSRRRGEGSTSATASFFMTNDIVRQLESVLDAVQMRLDELKAIKFGPKVPSDTLPSGKAYAKGDYVVKDLPVRLIPRSAAALRDRTYDFYDIPSYIVYADVSQVAEEEKSAFNQAVALHVKEDSHWLDSITAQYIDLTLTEEEEAWLVGRERWNSVLSPPVSSSPVEAHRMTLQSLVSHTSSVAPNAELVISLRATPTEEKVDKLQARNKAFLSVRCTKDIGESDIITLDTSDRKVTWAELADDDTAAESEESQGQEL